MVDELLAGAGPVVRRLLAPGQAMRRSQFEQLPLPPDGVVLLGDSITEQGIWDEWFPDHATLNRGIGGDTVGGVMARLDSAINQPAAISLLVGTNDLSGLGPSRDAATVADQMRRLVDELCRRAPDARLLLNSVMPRRASMADRVSTLNREYAAIATDAGATYVDLWPALAGPDRAMRAEFSRDSLHLNGPGYDAWVAVLRPHLAPYAS